MNHRRYIAYTVVRNGCSGGNLPPSGRKAGTVVRLYPHCPTGPAPRRGWMVVLRAANQNLLIAGGNHTLISSLGQRRYIVPCMGFYHSPAQVNICHVAGGKIAAPTYFNGWIHINNVGRPNNCQLSIVNCQFKKTASGRSPKRVFCGISRIRSAGSLRRWRSR